MFIKAERGDQEYTNNIQSIVSFLSLQEVAKIRETNSK